MSFANSTSRFDILPDDAGDPFEVASKKNKKKSGSGSGDGSKNKANKKGNPKTDKKQLQSLAFGSASEGKKKNKVAAAQNQSQQNGNCISNNDSTSPSASSKELATNDVQVDAGEQKNGNAPPQRKVMVRPKGMSNQQWEQWQKRDADIMDETYASDLQNALLQSKIEYETEQKNKPVVGKGKKKKPAAVPLTEFQARLHDAGGSMPNQNSMLNGGLNIRYLGSNNYQMQQTTEADDDLVERFRLEAKLELERERQKAIQRELLMSRQPVPPNMRSPNVHVSQGSAVLNPSPAVDEKDLMIGRLTEDNLRLRGEVDLLKDRVKAINNYLQAAQDVKDKAKLIYDLENMTKANNDLNEELRQVQLQLEQEKSRSSSAMLEIKKLLENRRRAATEGSNS